MGDKMSSSIENSDLYLFTNAVYTKNINSDIFGKITFIPSIESECSILFLHNETTLERVDKKKLKIIICHTNHPDIENIKNLFNTPIIVVDEKVKFNSGDIVTINTKGRIHRNYRTTSQNNAFLVTEVCNNLCIMCPQPPKHKDNYTYSEVANKVCHIIDMIDSVRAPNALCITGGEPTMLKDKLTSIIEHISNKLPTTLIHLLTNGRSFYYEDYVKKIADSSKGNILVGIPLFSHASNIHDYIVQSRGAFDQTLVGLLNCYKHNIPIELRIVLHKETIPHLENLAEFITRNLFFVKHVALMGMESMGFAKMNRTNLHIDPHDYKDVLSEAVGILRLYGIETRIFNIPLCCVNEDVRDICAQSISDFKNIYYQACDNCSQRSKCCGFFSSSTEKFHLTKHVTPF